MKTTLSLLIGILGLGLASCKEATGSLPSSYPLTKCVISGEELGSMGKPVTVSHEGTEVYLCCKSCIKDFNKDPAKYVQMVKDAAAKK